MAAHKLTKPHIMSFFSHLLTGDSAAFYANVADGVVWTIMGENHPLAGRYTSREQFLGRAMVELERYSTHR